MAIPLPLWLRAERIERLALALNAAPDPDPCAILIYTAAIPAPDLAAITGQTLLAVFELDDPAAVRVDNVITLQAAGVVQALASGDAAFGRVINGAGQVITDLYAGTTGSGAPLILDSLTIVAGGFVTMVSGTLTE